MLISKMLAKFTPNATGSRNMANFQRINAKINGKRLQIADIVHSVRKSGSGNRMMVSQFLPEVPK